MNEWTSTPHFEEHIRQSFKVPEIRTEFVDQLYGDIMRHAHAQERRSYPFPGLQPAWKIILGILLMVIIGTLLIGPQRVYAEFRKLLGYIPGMGIVDQSSSLRILVEPVQITRDGITVSVNQVVVTDSETRLNFGVSGVPLSAYPKDEAVTGCIEHEYLLLPDGTKMDVNSPIPPTVDEATFILPCIFNTLTGSVPHDWMLPFQLMDAPPDFKILPVIEVTPEVLSPDRGHESSTAWPETTPNAVSHAAVFVEKMIETEDGYILMGFVRPNIPQGSWLQITGAAIIRDANNHQVNYSFPYDVQPLDDSDLNQGGFAWVMQIKGDGVKFPLDITFSGVVISQIDPRASAGLLIDVGANPQAGQVWEIDQEVQLAGHTIRLISITADSRNGYSFQVDPGPNLSGVDVQIEGHQAIGGGGGGWQGPFYTSLSYNELPEGQLNILFSNPRSAGPKEQWQTEWQPENLRDFSSSTRTADICWGPDSLQSVSVLPAGMDGIVVITQMNPQLQILLARMDGSQSQVIARDSARAALSFDATHLAYTSTKGIMIVNSANGESSLIPGAFGRDLYWSPDGNRISVVKSGVDYGIFVINGDGSNPKQISYLGYESIAGWSPDSSVLYYAIPGSSGNGFQFRSVDVDTGNTKNLFILEDSSLKAPLPVVSPDGEWVAYRARDNSSLYIKNMDGSPARMLLEKPAEAINGIAWENGSHLIGVSMITNDKPDGEIFLISPDNCESYRLPGLSGELDGLFIP